MEIHPDFRELLALFEHHRVEYAIVGGYALAFHGAPRYTGDLDILVATDNENGARIMDALRDFGFGESNLKSNDFTKPGQFVRLGHPPVQVDILTSISGMSWKQVRDTRISGTYGGVHAKFIGRAEFIANKRASGRAKDLADVEALGQR